MQGVAMVLKRGIWSFSLPNLTLAKNRICIVESVQMQYGLTQESRVEYEEVFPLRAWTEQCIKLCNEGGGWIYYDQLLSSSR